VVRRGTASLAVLVGLLAWVASPAQAGGGRLTPVQERYNAGETATMVGYTAGPAPDEPFYAYLRSPEDGSQVYVGELAVAETAHGGYLRFRVSVTFDVPRTLAPGDYDLTYCSDPCSGRFLGDLVDSPVSIAVDPARRVVREWAPDDPEIANLAPDAVIVGPGFQTTAAELRAPKAPAPAPAPSTTLPAPVPAPPTAPDAPEAGEEMAWPLPTALVVASAAATGLVLSRRYRRPERPAVSPWRTPDAAPGPARG
jgi:hypothetical protein